jgi:hypothetical protein
MNRSTLVAALLVCWATLLHAREDSSKLAIPLSLANARTTPSGISGRAIVVPVESTSRPIDQDPQFSDQTGRPSVKLENSAPADIIAKLLDRSLHTIVINGDTFLQRDLTDYLNVTLGPVDDASIDIESDVNHRDRTILRGYFMRPNPSVATLTRYFKQASQEFSVPVSLLMTIGQVESNWSQVGPSIDHGWGVMHLVQNSYCDTLGDAARLLGVPGQLLKDDALQNIRGAAALIARSAGAGRQNFTRLADWLPALADFSGLVDSDLRELQAKNYLTTLNEGVSSSTVWGERVVIPAIATGAISSTYKTADSTKLLPAPLSADYGPALMNPAATCNYLTGRNHSIDTWVNHWIGTGTYLGTISWFKTCPGTGPGQRGAGIGASSAHFVIKNSNGEITQMVSVADSAYHAGASGQLYNNGRSIGVEHEATAANPGMWNSAAMLSASAALARYFKNLYGFPTTQNSSPGICGHNDMPGTSTDCPGPLPWTTWMSYFNAGSGMPPANDNCSGAVTLSSNTSCGFTTGSVVNATASGLAKPSCDGFSNPNMFDVWYKFTAVASSQTVTVDPSGSSGDPVVSVHSSCGGSALGCADGGGEGGTETLPMTGLSVGSTYYVRIYDYGNLEPTGTNADFQVCVTGTPVANYSLSITGGGTGQGTVNGNGINCTIAGGNPSGTCSANYPSGTAVSLTATPAGGSTFGSWGGSCGGTGGCSVTMTASKNVSASFTTTVTNYTLSVAGGGSGQGTVTGSGINCTISGGSASGTCSASYPSGTGVSLTATPSGSSAFSSWGGSCAGSGGCSVTMTANRNVSASFSAPVADYTLSVAGSGSGQGTVTGSGINCTSNGGSTSGTCASFYAFGTQISLTATPAGGSTFGGWSGEGCSGTGTCQVTMTQSRSVTAIFSSGGDASDLIVDGGFESAISTGNSAPGWITYPASGHSLIVAGEPYARTGSNHARLGTSDSTTDYLVQNVTIPANAVSPSLTFWVNVVTQESIGFGPFDYFYLSFFDFNGNLVRVLAQLTNEDAQGSNNTPGNYFRIGPIDVTAQKGSTLQLVFQGTTDPSFSTAFRVDDVSLQTGASDNPPVTSITAPANGATVSGTVGVSAIASDDVSVTALEIDIDGVLKASNAGATSLSYSWDTSQVPAGQHTIVSKASDSSGHTTTSSAVVVTVAAVPPPPPPGNLVATAISPSQVSLTWSSVAGATYQVLRSSNHGAFSVVGTPGVNSFTNTGLAPNTTYLYQVKAVNSSNVASTPSNTDLATTVIFTNAVVARSSRSASLDVLELRTAVNAVRAAAGLGATMFSDSLMSRVSIRAVHIAELRTSLNAARAALGFSALSYTDASLAGRVTIKAAHINELRAGVQ